MKTKYIMSILATFIMCSYGCNEEKDDTTDTKQCTQTGEILNESNNTCICDESRSFKGTAGNCTCKDNFRLQGDRCVDATPGHECPNTGEAWSNTAQACICDESRSFKGTAGNCTCKDNFKLQGDRCVDATPGHDCPNTGEVWSDTEQTCICDSSQHFTGIAGACTCQNPYKLQGNKCVDSTPGHECANPGEIYNDWVKTCVCDINGHWVGNANACICDRDYHQTNDNTCVKCADYETWNDTGKYCVTTEFCRNKFKDLKAGDTITFGNYVQAESGTTPAPLEWNVLEVKEDGTLIMISKYILLTKPFHEHTGSGSDTHKWSDCTLRSWLNGYNAQSNKSQKDYTNDNFIKTAFNHDETECLQINPITMHNTTSNDRVFILSLDEVESYYPNETEKRAYVTPLVKASLIADYYSDRLQCDGNDPCSSSWWTRTDGSFGPITILKGGTILTVGTAQTDDIHEGVRPVLRVK